MLKIQRTLSLYSSCPRCGQELNCGPCKCETKWEYPFERIVPFTDFSAPDVRTIIHHIKYRKKKQLAYFMGELCATDFNRLITEPFDYAVPVPLHWIKKKMRGFNQAEWFCRGLLHGQKRDRPPIILNCALRRRRYTKKQAGLRRPERWKNVDNAFAVIRSAKPLLAGKSVLLVDDVITTGATCAAASIALISAGCRSVTVLALARD